MGRGQQSLHLSSLRGTRPRKKEEDEKRGWACAGREPEKEGGGGKDLPFPKGPGLSQHTHSEVWEAKAACLVL